MKSHFSRIITLLRKEKGLSQKIVASDLGVSQALLSHYEKGIRECGLDFVVKVSSYYNVSCDFLLGKSPDRQGAKILVEDIPDADKQMSNITVGRGGILPTLNKKLLMNSISILYDMLSKANNKGLTIEVSSYLMISIYKVFRMLNISNKQNLDKMFSLNQNIYKPLSDASISICEGKINSLINGNKVDSYEPLKDTSAFLMTNEHLSSNYGSLTPAFLNLIQNAEEKSNKLLNN